MNWWELITENITTAKCTEAKSIFDQVAQFRNDISMCTIVSKMSLCQLESGFINYTLFAYCLPGSVAVATILVFIWMLVMLMILASTADSYFGPNLISVTKLLRLSPNMAGVTLLAFGNGAADIFSSLSATLGSEDSNIELLFGSLLGAGLAVNLMTAGIIMIVRTFVYSKWNFMKDFFFYGISMIWVFTILHKGYIHIGESIGFLLLYVLFVVCSWLLNLLVTRFTLESSPSSKTDTSEQSEDIEMKKVTNQDQNPNSRIAKSISLSLSRSPYIANWIMHHEDQVSVSIQDPQNIRRRSISSIVSPTHLNVSSIKPKHHSQQFVNRGFTNSGTEALPVSAATGSLAAPQINPHLLSVPQIRINDDLVDESEEPESEVKDNDDLMSTTEPSCREILLDLMKKLRPFEFDEWNASAVHVKIIVIFEAPLKVLLTIMIPVMDDEQELSGWNKVLNCWHVLICPLFMAAATTIGFNTVGSANVMVIVLPVSVVLSVVVWLITTHRAPPRHHWMFSLLGYVTAIVWIYILANEIVNLLGTLGMVLGISEAILGLTLLAWANSLSDMLSNIMLAMNGFPEIAYAACIGGPLFNALISVGLSFTIKAAKTGIIIPMQVTSLLYVLVSFTLVSTAVNLVLAFVFRFSLNKFIGFILLGIYVVFLVLAFLAEFDIF